MADGESICVAFLRNISRAAERGCPDPHRPNQEFQPPQLEETIGADVLDTLSKQTGLSHEELLARLSRELPEAVNRYTPDGRLPDSA